MRKVYFDHNATTPIHPGVASFVKEFFGELFGNPSSLHWAGREVRPYVEEARAQRGGPDKGEALRDRLHERRHRGKQPGPKGVAYALLDKGNHIVTTKVEHPAVSNTCAFLESRVQRHLHRRGLQWARRPRGRPSGHTKDTILMSVMQANNETGTLLPIKEIGRIAHEEGVLFHSDMVQCLGKIDIDMADLNVDLAAFSGHKLYAPKGIGALYVREGLDIENLVHGGSQEMGRRGGTENMIGIAAFGKACEDRGGGDGGTGGPHGVAQDEAPRGAL